MTHEQHKKLGIDLFNATWDLIDKADRTEAENFEMIHAAHASAYHWLKAGGDATNQARSHSPARQAAGSSRCTFQAEARISTVSKKVHKRA